MQGQQTCPIGLQGLIYIFHSYHEQQRTGNNVCNLLHKFHSTHRIFEYHHFLCELKKDRYSEDEATIEIPMQHIKTLKQS